MRYYHNARCRKSREGLALLEEKGLEPEVVEYMKEPLSMEELEQILQHLDYSADELIRTSEKIWKEEFKDKELSEEELILAMLEYPQLMERPILDNGKEARIGRPAEKLLEII